MEEPFGVERLYVFAATQPFPALPGDELPNGLRKLWTGHPRKDWTTGCVAVTDAEIREIWSLVPTGARVVIHP